MHSLPVQTSIFDLLKCGPGPSSSHTIGPMKAGYDFLQICQTLDKSIPEDINRVEVRLFGSLSATGHGHGTDVAVIAGLLGYQPAQCPPDLLDNIRGADTRYYFNPRGIIKLPLSLDNIIFDNIIHSYPYNNTLTISLIAKDEHVIFTQEYYSVGGGFLEWKGWKKPEVGKPAHTYHNMRVLQENLKFTGLTLHELILDNETAITGIGRATTLEKLESIMELMIDSVHRGLATEGVLPGTLNVQRKAKMLYENAKGLSSPPDRFIANLSAYAMATSEENAAGGVIVTAPTCGAAGVLPALLYAMRYDLGIGDRALREGLLASTTIAFLAKHNAAIAGAEVGCQGEIGVASSMGAALVAHAKGCCALRTENAAEIALEHHLGLTCDPVGGYVQIPCIERNAMGAVKAYTAYLLANGENPEDHKVSLDSAIAAMAETGKEMNSKFKETSLGGLAVSMVAC